MFEMADEVCPVGEGAEEACGVLVPGLMIAYEVTIIRLHTYIQMIPILLGWKLSAFLDDPMPAVIGTVLVDLCCHY